MNHLVQMMTCNELAFGVDGLIEESAASRGAGVLAIVNNTVAFSDQAFMNAFVGM